MGVGLDAAGTIPAGFGTQIVSTALYELGYGKSTSGAVSSILIDATTRDVSFDEYGSEEGMGDLAQIVQVLISTEFDSRLIAPGTGLKLPQKVDATTRLQLEQSVKSALRPVLDDGLIELLSVQVESNQTNMFAVVEWRDTRTDKIGTTNQRLVV